MGVDFKVCAPHSPQGHRCSSAKTLLAPTILREGPEGVKWDWDWPRIWVGKWDLIHWDWDFCTGNGTQNIKWEWDLF